MRPTFSFFLFWIIAAGLTLYLVERFLALELTLSVAIALTVATALLYGLDKV